MTLQTVIDSPDDFPRFHWRWYEWLVLGAIVAGAVAFMFLVGP